MCSYWIYFYSEDIARHTLLNLTFTHDLDLVNFESFFLMIDKRRSTIKIKSIIQLVQNLF